MSAPLFDETARDGRQGELAHIIRQAVQIRPLGPNSLAVHAAGGSVHLTPAEAEEAARAVLESDWLAAIRAAAWDEGYGDDLTCSEPRANPYRGATP